ncbi:FK506-binding protein 1B [Neonectria magnoliae]|uniref:peptidylprolyl isomerase n=1 Tax=Neonectria magnoliae TaxID=2732573 RepID=A0ABR1I8N3_9HYPO
MFSSARPSFRKLSPFLITRSPLTTTTTTARNFHSSLFNMSVSKTTHQEGTGAIPVPGQTVTIEYTGYLKDTSKPDLKGEKFDSSVGRGDFVTKIGVGAVIKGWDNGVTQMKVGEKATLDISAEFGYGARGFPGHIPPNSDLIFDVYLKNVK